MRKPSDWETTTALMDTNSRETITPGGHIVRILNANVQMANNKEQLVVSFDIAEGTSLDGVCKRLYDHKRESSTGRVDWPLVGVYKQFTHDYKDDSRTNPYFKGFIKAIEDSNPGFRWNWVESDLCGKYVGLIFREEEFKGRDGDLRVAIRAFAPCKAEDAMSKEAPPRKMLSESKKNTTFSEVTDDNDLPF